VDSLRRPGPPTSGSPRTTSTINAAAAPADCKLVSSTLVSRSCGDRHGRWVQSTPAPCAWRARVLGLRGREGARFCGCFEKRSPRQSGKSFGTAPRPRAPRSLASCEAAGAAILRHSHRPGTCPGTCARKQHGQNTNAVPIRPVGKEHDRYTPWLHREVQGRVAGPVVQLRFISLFPGRVRVRSSELAHYGAADLA
jgi:hypothetical protein